MKLPKTKPRTQGVAPFAYDTDLENKVFVRNDKVYKVLKEVVEGIVDGKYKSIREGRLFIQSKGYNISVQTLSTHVRQEREDRGQSPRYRYSRKQKAKMAARRSVKDKQKRVQSLDKKLKAAKASLNQQTKVQSKLDEPLEASTVEGKVLTEDELDLLTPNTKEIVDEKIIFRPNDGPQTDFLAAPETDVLYGGAAGGGKSYAMLVDPPRS